MVLLSCIKEHCESDNFPVMRPGTSCTFSSPTSYCQYPIWELLTISYVCLCSAETSSSRIPCWAAIYSLHFEHFKHFFAKCSEWGLFQRWQTNEMQSLSMAFRLYGPDSQLSSWKARLMWASSSFIVISNAFPPGHDPLLWRHFSVASFTNLDLQIFVFFPLFSEIVATFFYQWRTIIWDLSCQPKTVYWDFLRGWHYKQFVLLRIFASFQIWVCCHSFHAHWAVLHALSVCNCGRSCCSVSHQPLILCGIKMWTPPR